MCAKRKNLKFNFKSSQEFASERECAVFIFPHRYAALMRFLACGRDASPRATSDWHNRHNIFFYQEFTRIRVSSCFIALRFSFFYDRLFGIYRRSRIYVPASLAADFRMEASRHERLRSSSHKKQPCIEEGHLFSRKFFHHKERYKPILEHVLSARCYRHFLLFLSKIKIFNCTLSNSLFHLYDWALLFDDLRSSTLWNTYIN